MVHVVGLNLSREDLLADLLTCAANGGVVGLDTETKFINPRKEAPANGRGRISCWSVSTPKYEKVFLWADQLEFFTPWLESNAPKTGHNIFSFDLHMFWNHAINLSGIVGDTKRLSRLLYSCKTRSHGLKDLARYQLGIVQPAFKSLFTRPAHKLEYVQESRKIKGVVEPLEERVTKRKVGETKGVPTLLVSGERGIFGKAVEFIPLDSIPTDYPDRLEALYEYASADALIARLLYYKLLEQLEQVEWKVSK